MKHPKYLLLLTLCLLLTACEPKEPAPGSISTAQSGSTSASDSSEPVVSEPEPGIPAPDESAPDVSQPELSAPLTQEELAAAHQAAMDYYAGTVFEVDTLTEIEPRQGEIAFRVSCSKGGEKVDPDRTIFLERQEGVWTVVNEGY